jgi:cytochrome c biogenesis protein ResB
MTTLQIIWTALDIIAVIIGLIAMIGAIKDPTNLALAVKISKMGSGSINRIREVYPKQRRIIYMRVMLSFWWFFSMFTRLWYISIIIFVISFICVAIYRLINMRKKMHEEEIKQLDFTFFLLTSIVYSLIFRFVLLNSLPQIM